MLDDGKLTKISPPCDPRD